MLLCEEWKRGSSHSKFHLPICSVSDKALHVPLVMKAVGHTNHAAKSTKREKERKRERERERREKRKAECKGQKPEWERA